ncbi:thiamine pyrophosphate-dependent enzyme [Nesterenkonia marinintestina]|uniref:thiamine pyrophosphate-dependent enzyme n=1 Tax=Nesterenkonia marinintestina TaxID=2979865 RepID=UPI0021C0486E|nr:thiamine pyrophosphate-dependent enzyme [Nesterenkonia sp. GX14115]
MNSIDEHFRNAVSAYQGVEVRPESEVPPVVLERLFRAQVQSRHLDFAARWLQSEGAGYYTIGSAGHESNAALGLLSRVDDPALLHYRSGGFYAARAQMAGHSTGARDVLMSLTCSTEDPISGGRHKVFGHPDLNIIPQTSTISSHIPRAVGLAFALGLSRADQTVTPWSDDAVVICSFGDASVNHSTATGGFNAAGYMSHRGLECPVLFVCEDNDIGISTRTPEGWTEAALSSLPGVDYWSVEGADPESLLRVTEQALDTVRVQRRPGVLHLRTVRFMGHAGSDAEIAYRTHTEIVADYMRDPVLKTAERLIDQGIRTSAEILQDYEQSRDQVMDVARELIDTSRLKTPHDVMKPLSLPTPESSTTVVPSQRVREQTWGDRLPEHTKPMTLAQAINTTLIDQMAHDRQVLVFGEDVGTKGGVYGVTRGLRKRFGGRRVFDTLLDEQTILGTALGAALVGYTPVPEIQYLAYLHNAEDQLRGEAATLRFFSAGQYQNGMVVRIAGLAYQKGFGGHFHNDNSLAVLLDIPGVIVVVPSHPAEVPELLRTCFDLAQRDGRVCIFVEPIALYHTRDLHEPGDGLWTAGYRPPSEQIGASPLGEITRHGDGRDLLMVTFGNGLPMSLRAARTLADADVATTTVDLRWLAPLPEEALLSAASEFSAVLIVDETRRSGGVSEHIVAALIDGGYRGRLARITSADSFIPLGPAAHTVLLGEDDIVQAAEDLLT